MTTTIRTARSRVHLLGAMAVLLVAGALIPIASAGPAIAATTARTYATESVRATYYDAHDRVIARTPTTTTHVAAHTAAPSGPTAPATADGDSSTNDRFRPAASMTPAAAASTTCKSGRICGSPTRAGCVTWQVYRTEVHQGITDYRYEVDVHYCWKNRVIRRRTVTVTSSLTHIAPVINDQGTTEADNGYYTFFPGVTDSGHFSKYQRHVQYCGGWICYAYEDVWIHEYVHGDGTMYFHTGTH